MVWKIGVNTQEQKKPAGADMIRIQARRKAEPRIRRESAHMAHEQQALPSTQTLTEELIREMPSDFWKAK